MALPSAVTDATGASGLLWTARDAMKKKGSIEERLIRSMSQAVDIAEGTTAPSREYDLPLMTAKRVSVPPAPVYDAKSVIAIRNNLNLSQTVFAQALNVSPGTVRSWEQGEKPPQGPSRRLLQIAAKSPETLLGAIVIREPGEPKAEEPKRRGDRSMKSADRRTGNGRRRGKHGARRRGQA
ncbi:MAG TPA: helix-turn-helix domain-containing protein [Gemmatimonadaceae bacterium]|nr:helix-turn-helix domain-containing protein [Gemmatimonadaceae bacterium]